MNSTAVSPGPKWPIIVLAIIGLIAVSPILIGVLFAGLALTAGLVVLAVKIGVFALIVWAVVMLFKGLFGSKRRLPARDEIVTVVPRFDVDPDLEREGREHMAALDQELERAIAKKNADAK